MAETKTHIAADQLLHMSFPGERVELSEGELIRMAPAGFEHGRVGMNVGSFLNDFVNQRHLGAVVGPDTGFRLDEQTVRSPDISFVSKERLDKTGSPAGFFPSSPDLAVEIISPSDSATDLQKKIGEYFGAGTRLVWVVYTQLKQVHVYRGPKQIEVLEASDTLSGDDVLPGFSIPVEKIFL